MESRESLHACESALKIKCTIGKQLHDINFSNDLKCTGWYDMRINIIFNYIVPIAMHCFHLKKLTIRI